MTPDAPSPREPSSREAELASAVEAMRPARGARRFARKAWAGALAGAALGFLAGAIAGAQTLSEIATSGGASGPPQ